MVMVKKERIVQTAIWFLEGMITGVVCGLSLYSYKICKGEFAFICILLDMISIYLFLVFIRQMFKVINIFKEEVENLERNWKELEKII